MYESNGYLFSRDDLLMQAPRFYWLPRKRRAWAEAKERRARAVDVVARYTAYARIPVNTAHLEALIVRQYDNLRLPQDHQLPIRDVVGLPFRPRHSAEAAEDLTRLDNLADSLEKSDRPLDALRFRNVAQELRDQRRRYSETTGVTWPDRPYHAPEGGKVRRLGVPLEDVKDRLTPARRARVEREGQRLIDEERQRRTRQPVPGVYRDDGTSAVLGNPLHPLHPTSGLYHGGHTAGRPEPILPSSTGHESTHASNSSGGYTDSGSSSSSGGSDGGSSSGSSSGGGE